MAEWKVSIEQVELLPHPNADSLDIIKAGGRQFVARKGLYQSGDKVVVIPEKSLLPDYLAIPFLQYLGKENRVKATKLRGELSEGILIPVPQNLIDYPEGVDISKKLEITLYEPPIPTHLAGDLARQQISFLGHDCDNFRLYEDEFEPDEYVIVTEKIHGSQLNLTVITKDGEVIAAEVTSKGLGKKGLVLQESNSNFYWRCVHNDDLLSKIARVYPNDTIQLIGEAIPCQKGFTYGINPNKPTVLIFKMIRNGRQLPFLTVYNYQLPGQWENYWNTVPLLAVCRFSDLDLSEYLAQPSYLSKRTDNTIKEGIVISPQIPRLSKNGKSDLHLKLLTDAYMKKGYNGEEFN